MKIKANNVNHAMPRLQTRDERLRWPSQPAAADANGQPGVPAATVVINVQFAPDVRLQFQIIRWHMKTNSSMNASPFAELMRHPEKLQAAFSLARRENDAFDAARKFSRAPAAATPPTSRPETNRIKK